MDLLTLADEVRSTLGKKYSIGELSQIRPIVGFSGGPDSRLLLEIAIAGARQNYWRPPWVAHLSHGWRPEGRSEAFRIQQEMAARQIPSFIQYIRTGRSRINLEKGLSRYFRVWVAKQARKNGIGLPPELRKKGATLYLDPRMSRLMGRPDQVGSGEERGRFYRQAIFFFLVRLAEEVSGDPNQPARENPHSGTGRIWTGFHLSDWLEDQIMKIRRGRSPAYSYLPNTDTDHPLLVWDKNQILEFCRSLNLPFWLEKENESDSNQRARLRRLHHTRNAGPGVARSLELVRRDQAERIGRILKAAGVSGFSRESPVPSFFRADQVSFPAWLRPLWGPPGPVHWTRHRLAIELSFWSRLDDMDARLLVQTLTNHWRQPPLTGDNWTRLKDLVARGERSRLFESGYWLASLSGPLRGVISGGFGAERGYLVIRPRRFLRVRLFSGKENRRIPAGLRPMRYQKSLPVKLAGREKKRLSHLWQEMGVARVDREHILLLGDREGLLRRIVFSGLHPRYADTRTMTD